MYNSIVGRMSGLVLVLAGLLEAAARKPPNIVMIVADDLGYNDVGWHNPAMLTPHLDRLAGEGLRLEQHYVQPLCTPTRCKTVLRTVFCRDGR